MSAVGHETDFTICDFVADLRAPTPSAAAELVIRSRQEISDSVAALHERLRRSMQYKLLYERQNLLSLEKNRVFARMEDAIARRQQRVDDLRYRLQSLMNAHLADASRRLELAASNLRQRDLRQQLKIRERELFSRLEALASATQRYLMRRRSRLEHASAKLAALSPVAILERGYSLIFDAQGSLVKSAIQLAPGDQIQARLAQGKIAARVESVVIGSQPGNPSDSPQK
jgi:exodeoxyribonuclease VII large subunit